MSASGPSGPLVIDLASNLLQISYILLVRNPKFGVWMHLWMVICCVPFLGHCDLDLWPRF